MLERATQSRDLRIDFLRGAALLFIFIDHVERNPWSDYTPKALGFSDMAEVFFFLSGYVCALSYGRVLSQRGFWACQRKALYRALQIYAANLVTLIAFVALVVAWNNWFPTLDYRATIDRWETIAIAPWASTIGIVTLTFEPMVLAVLPFYMIMLCALPAMLALHARRPVALPLTALWCYGLVQMFPEHVALPEPWGMAWVFNPFAWQLVFVAGAFCGVERDWASRLIPRSLPAVIIAVVALEFAFVYKYLSDQTLISFYRKVDCGPLRILHFYCLLIVGRFVLRRENTLWQSRLLAPTIVCGRNSLATYCAGGLFATVGTLVLATVETKWRWVVCINLGGCLGSFIVAGTWGRIKANAFAASIALSPNLPKV